MDKIKYPLVPLINDGKTLRSTVIHKFLGSVFLSINSTTPSQGVIQFWGNRQVQKFDQRLYQQWFNQLRTSFVNFAGLKTEKEYLGSVNEHTYFLSTYISTTIFCLILNNVEDVRIDQPGNRVRILNQPFWFDRYLERMYYDDTGFLFLVFRDYGEIQNYYYSTSAATSVVQVGKCPHTLPNLAEVPTGLQVQRGNRATDRREETSVSISFTQRRPEAGHHSISNDSTTTTGQRGVLLLPSTIVVRGHGHTDGSGVSTVVP